MKYEIWVEGYCATGMEGIPAKAQLVANNVEGKNFDEAVKNWIDSQDKEWLKKHWGEYTYCNGRHCLWGCQLFPTEEEARKSFG